MLTVAEALDAVLTHARVLPARPVPLAGVLGLTLVAGNVPVIRSMESAIRASIV